MNIKTHSKSVHVPSISLQREIVEKTNEVALYLYNYYVSKAKSPSHNLLDDTMVGRSIGWTARKVKDNRLKLTTAGFIYFHHKRHSGVNHFAWVFGEEKIAQYKRHANDITLTEAVDDQGHSIIAESNIEEDNQ